MYRIATMIIIFLLLLPSCSNLGDKHLTIREVPRFPNATNEEIQPFRVLSGKNGSVKELLYVFDTKDNEKLIISHYKKILQEEEWVIIEEDQKHIKFMLQNNCPVYYIAILTQGSTNGLTHVEAHLISELCR